MSSPGMLEVVDGVCCRRSLQRLVSGTNCPVIAMGLGCLALQLVTFAEPPVFSLFPPFYGSDLVYSLAAAILPDTFHLFAPRRFVVSGATVVLR